MEPVHKLNKRMPVSTMLDPKIMAPAIRASFAKLDPRLMIKNPVMFVVEVVAMLTTIIFVRDLVTGAAGLGFTFQIILWLWFTVLFANFAEAVAEGRGKAQAESLKKTRTESQAKLLQGLTKTFRLVPGTSLKVGDMVLVEAGDVIPSDGEVIEGMASVDESSFTGESIPSAKEIGTKVIGGTLNLDGRLIVRVTKVGSETFLSQIVRLMTQIAERKPLRHARDAPFVQIFPKKREFVEQKADREQNQRPFRDFFEQGCVQPIAEFFERKPDRDPDDEHERRKNEVRRGETMPFCVAERRENELAIASGVDDDHERDGQATEEIDGTEAHF